MRKRILITGASGFIGRRLVRQIKEAFPDCDLQCLVSPIQSDYEDQGRDMVCQAGPRAALTVDLLAPPTSFPFCSPNIVFHLAATTSTWADDFS